MKWLTEQHKIVINAGLARERCDGLVCSALPLNGSAGGMIIQLRTPMSGFAPPAQLSRAERQSFMGKLSPPGAFSDEIARIKMVRTLANVKHAGDLTQAGKRRRGARMPRYTKEIDAAPTGNPRGDCRQG